MLATLSTTSPSSAPAMATTSLLLWLTAAKHVDAVELDPKLFQIGFDNHPNHPYQDPRVSVHITDGREDGASASDALTILGLLAVAPTALSGLSDWADTVGPERRLGMIHALASVGGSTLYLAALLSRRGGNRTVARLFSVAGLGVLSAGGYIGGHLVFARGIGVDHTVFDEAPADWTRVAREGDLQPDHAGVRPGQRIRRPPLQPRRHRPRCRGPVHPRGRPPSGGRGGRRALRHLPLARQPVSAHGRLGGSRPGQLSAAVLRGPDQRGQRRGATSSELSPVALG